MNIVDIVLDKLSVGEKEKSRLRLQIIGYAVERANIVLRDQFSDGEQARIKSFLANPDAESIQDVNTIFFSKEQYQTAYTKALMNVIQDLLDDSQIVTPELRESILADLESYLEKTVAVLEA